MLVVLEGETVEGHEAGTPGEGAAQGLGVIKLVLADVEAPLRVLGYHQPGNRSLVLGRDQPVPTQDHLRIAQHASRGCDFRNTHPRFWRTRALRSSIRTISLPRLTVFTEGHLKAMLHTAATCALRTALNHYRAVLFLDNEGLHIIKQCTTR